MKIVESTISIKSIKSAVEVKHTHENKELLDSLTSDGISTEYLGADGQYHTVPANFSVDAFLEFFNQDGTVKAEKDLDGKLVLNTDNTFADETDGKVIGSINVEAHSPHQVDLSIKEVDVRTGSVSESDLKHITSGTGVSVSAGGDELVIGLIPTEAPFTDKMDKQSYATPSNLGIFNNAGQIVDSGVKTSSFASKTEFDAHTSNSNVHVSSADKANWNAKQHALTTPQLSAVDSGITTSKVTSYDAYATSKVSVAGNQALKNVVTDASGNIVTEDKPNLNAKVDKVPAAINDRVASFTDGGNIKDSGLILGLFPTSQTVYDYMNATISSNIGGSFYQGTFNYFGTQAQVEAVEDPIVDPYTGLSTAIAFEGDISDFEALLKGVYEDSAWTWEPVAPAPTGGNWFEIDVSLVSSLPLPARVIVRMDGINPASLDVRVITHTQLDEVTIGLDTIGKVSLKLKRLSSGKDVLNATTSDNIAYEFTDDEGMDTSLTIKEVLDAKEAVFTKNTAFNKDFDTTSGGGASTTVVGNLDTRLTNARSASDVYSWAKNETLEAEDVPDLDATKITSGYLDPERIEGNAISADKLGIETTTTIFIDGNREDTYTENGSMNTPFKSIASALNFITSEGLSSASISLATGTYDSGSADLSLPDIPLVIYGNNSVIKTTGTISIPNANFVRYNLFTEASQVVFSGSYVAEERVIIFGGSIKGNITVNNYAEFQSTQLTDGTLTVNGQALVTNCTPTSKFISNGTLFINNVNLNTGSSDYLLKTSATGVISIVNSLINNTTNPTLCIDVSESTGVSNLSNLILSNGFGNINHGTRTSVISKIIGNVIGTGTILTTTDFAKTPTNSNEVANKEYVDTLVENELQDAVDAIADMLGVL